MCTKAAITGLADIIQMRHRQKVKITAGRQIAGHDRPHFLPARKDAEATIDKAVDGHTVGFHA